MITIISVTPHKSIPATGYLQSSRGLETAVEETYLVECYSEGSGLQHIGFLKQGDDIYRPFAIARDMTEARNPVTVTIEFEDATTKEYADVISISQVPQGSSFEKGKLKLKLINNKVITLSNCVKWKDANSEGCSARKYLAFECVKLTAKEKAMIVDTQ